MSFALAIRHRLPGVLLCALLGLAAVGLQGLEARLTGRAWLEALVLAILLGAAVRTLWTPGPLWSGGIEFSARTLLELAVALLGAGVSAGALAAVGPAMLVGIALVVALSVAGGYAIARACAEASVPCELVKVVSDPADETAGHTWLEQADALARTIAEVVAQELG